MLQKKRRSRLKPVIEDELDETISLYETVGAPIRNMRLYTKWLYNIFSNTCLSCVENENKPEVALDKTKLTLFVTLLDDIADDYEIRDRDLLRKSVKIPWNYDQEYPEDYLEVTRQIWKDVITSIEDYPRYGDFENLLFFDLEQFLDSIKYAFLSNTLGLDNKLENERYLPHNFMVIVYGDMDIMRSNSFYESDLSALRPILYFAQEICHIANVIRTYPREIKQRDFSCPIISRGVREGLISREDLLSEPEKAERKLKALLPRFEKRATKNFEKIAERVGETESINISKYLESVKGAFLEIKSCEYSTSEDR